MVPVPAVAGDLSAYLRARAADAAGQPAAADYALALAAAPDDATIALRAYRQALVAGDDALAARAVAVMRRTGVLPADAALIPLGDAARAGDPAGVEAALATLGASPLAIVGPALSAWVRFVRGQGVAEAPASGLNPVARRLLAETRPLLLIAAGRADEGFAAVLALGGATRPPLDLRIAAAQLLFAGGHDAPARRLLAGDDAVLARLRDGTGAKPTLGFAVSRLLARVAADLSSDETAPLGIALARGALRADPGYDRARLLLADRLADLGATDLALGALDAVAADSAFAPAVASARITVLNGAGRTDAALALARTAATAPDAREAAWERYAELLSQGGAHAEAAGWYRRLVEGGDAGNWSAWLRLGNALDLSGDWPRAKAALTQAVKLAPDEPLALNNLGYARAEHGERRDAIRLLERAQALAPDDTSIADSLGWTYHLDGKTARALPLVERAAADQPNNAEISDHLGDIYWSLGRRFEARYAWNAAQVAGGGAGVAAKIDRGLPR